MAMWRFRSGSRSGGNFSAKKGYMATAYGLQLGGVYTVVYLDDFLELFVFYVFVTCMPVRLSLSRRRDDSTISRFLMRLFLRCYRSDHDIFFFFNFRSKTDDTLACVLRALRFEPMNVLIAFFVVYCCVSALTFSSRF